MDINPTILRAHSGDIRPLALAHLAKDLRDVPQAEPVQIDLNSFQGLLTPDDITSAALSTAHKITFTGSRAA